MVNKACVGAGTGLIFIATTLTIVISIIQEWVIVTYPATINGEVVDVCLDSPQPLGKLGVYTAVFDPACVAESDAAANTTFAGLARAEGPTTEFWPLFPAQTSLNGLSTKKFETCEAFFGENALLATSVATNDYATTNVWSALNVGIGASYSDAAASLNKIFDVIPALFAGNVAKVTGNFDESVASGTTDLFIKVSGLLAQGGVTLETNAVSISSACGGSNTFAQCSSAAEVKLTQVSGGNAGLAQCIATAGSDQIAVSNCGSASLNSLCESVITDFDVNEDPIATCKTAVEGALSSVQDYVDGLDLLSPACGSGANFTACVAELISVSVVEVNGTLAISNGNAAMLATIVRTANGNNLFVPAATTNQTLIEVMSQVNLAVVGVLATPEETQKIEGAKILAQLSLVNYTSASLSGFLAGLIGGLNETAPSYPASLALYGGAKAICDMCTEYSQDDLVVCESFVGANFAPFPQNMSATLQGIVRGFYVNPEVIAVAMSKLEITDATVAAGLVKVMTDRVIEKCTTSGNDCLNSMIGTAAQAIVPENWYSNDYLFNFAVKLKAPAYAGQSFANFAAANLYSTAAGAALKGCISKNLSRAFCGVGVNTQVVNNFFEDPATANQSYVEQCNDDVEDARRIKLAQKLMPASIGLQAVGLILAVVALAASKGPAGVVGAVLALAGTACATSALLLVRGAPVYAAVGGDVVPDDSLYTAGVATPLAYALILSGIVGGITVAVGSLIGGSADDQMVTKVDATY